MNASFNVTVMYNTALIAHGREGEGASGGLRRGVIKGVGSKAGKQKKKVGREGCKKATKVVSESEVCCRPD